MNSKNVSFSKAVLLFAIALIFAFSAIGLSGCGKKDAGTGNGGNVTTTQNPNGGVTLETSATVNVEIPKDQK